MSKELLQGLGSVTTNGTSVKRENGYLKFTGQVWPGVLDQYIPIQNCANVFQYDITFESDSGNWFYIGIERYASDKTTGENASCIYLLGTYDTQYGKTRIKGTVNLNQDVVAGKKTAYIRLRILNNWTYSSGNNVSAKIYKISLRELTADATKVNINQSGVLFADTIFDGNQKVSLDSSGVLDCENFYEY